MTSPSARMAALALLLAGCAEGSLKGGDEGGIDTADPTSSDSAGETTPTLGLVPELQHFDAALHVVGGTPELATSSLTVTLHAATGEVVCTQTLPIVAVTDEIRPERALLGWWRFDTGEGVPDGSCAPVPPTTLRLGLEPYDVQLDPVVLATGYESATASSAVIQTTGTNPLWLGGLFGTADQLAGYAPAPTARPIPDGDWSWVGLLLLPL